MSIESQRIEKLFAHDIHRTIEEVIKVDQSNEEVVRGELQEYVTTQTIRDHFIDICDRFAETPSKPHEGIGIWISGFFGSGKSSFAKILGYILENRSVSGSGVTDLFMNRLPGAGTEKLRVLLRDINARIPTMAVIFDVSTDRGVRSGSERITELMYKALLRDLGYSQDFNLAELEINLEADGRLDEFESRYESLYKKSWRIGRGLISIAVGQASRVMHDMDSRTYPSADSWARGLHGIEFTTDPNRFAARVFDLTARRRKGRTVVFIIDEVGRYVARSTDKMLDLQGVVQALGAKGRGRAWVAVTSQERLEEIVDSLDKSRIELAILRDRFPLRVDLVASDISEVTSTRVLAKRADASRGLEEMYDRHKGQIGIFTRLMGSARYPGINAPDFARLYPFLPYQIDLIVDIISGLRLQVGGSIHTGGGSRTIIKLAQQAVVDERVGLGQRNMGSLVTLDLVYDLIDQYVHPERRADIERIARDFPPDEHPLAAKVSKAICLLENVKNVKRSPETLAAVLHPAVDAPSQFTDVQMALNLLKVHQWIEEGEHGWQLLSPLGKQWAVERMSLGAKEYEYARYKKQLLEEVLRGVRDYRHKGHRTFRPNLLVAGEILGSGGDIDVELVLADEGQWDVARKDCLEKSRPEATRSDKKVYWVAPLSDAFYRELLEYHRSTRMIERYKREAKEKGFGEQLEAENRRLLRHSADARNRLCEGLMSGETYFQGVKREVAALSDQLSDVLQKVFTQVVPELYPKFDLASVPVKDTDITRILEEKTLASLPEVYYTGANRLGLVVKEGLTYKPNPDAEAAQEVLQYITRHHRPPERVFGKAMLDAFRGLGYGWDNEAVRLITASLLRAGKIEVVSGGQRIQSHADPGAREAFTTLPAFRSASFAPKEGQLDWQDIVSAAQAYSDIFGEDVGFDSAAVVAEALKQRHMRETVLVNRVHAGISTQNLPGVDKLENYLRTLSNVVKNATDDLIRAFLAELDLVREGHALAMRLDKELNSTTLDAIKYARQVLQSAWPSLASRPEGEVVQARAERLLQTLKAERWFDALPDIQTDSADIAGAYVALYQNMHEQRARVYKLAMEEVESHPKWPELNSIQKDTVLHPLRQRVGAGETFSEKQLPTNPTLGELGSHLEGVDTLKNRAVFEIERLTTENSTRIERVRVAQFVSGALESEEALDAALVQLKEHCSKLIATGAKIILE